MRRASVVDDCVRKERARIAALDPGERVALALALGRRDLESYRQSHGLAADEARRDVERRRQRRRRASAVMAAVVA